MSILGRTCEYKWVWSALGVGDDDLMPPCLFLWGMASTGKTLVLNTAIDNSLITSVARISCIEIMCGRRPFFETLLRQLDPDSEPKCDNLRLFIRSFRNIVKKKKRERILLVLDDAEQVRKDHSDILDLFSSLQELTDGNVCVVLSTRLSPSSFVGVDNLMHIPTLHFPQYSKEEVIQIITISYKPPTAEHSLFTFYVGMVISVFHQGCRELKKLIRLVKSHWPIFNRKCETEGVRNLHKLWKTIEPLLKADFKALNSQFLPMTEVDEDVPKENEGASVGASAGVSAGASAGTSTGGSAGVSAGGSANGSGWSEIPRNSRYVLIAAYLATHNPPATDKRFFVKGATRKSGVGGGKRKVQGIQNGSSKTVRSFELNRLTAIFSFLVQYCSGGSEAYEPSLDLLIQISTLCQEQFIQSLGEDPSGNFKFRCLADYDFILGVANSVNFELNNYLARLL